MGELEVWTIEVEISHADRCPVRNDQNLLHLIVHSGECPDCRADADVEAIRDA